MNGTRERISREHFLRESLESNGLSTEHLDRLLLEEALLDILKIEALSTTESDDHEVLAIIMERVRKALGIPSNWADGRRGLSAEWFDDEGYYIGIWQDR